MRSAISSIVALVSLISSCANAADLDARTSSFSDAYVALCMKHINDLESLRSQLQRSAEPLSKDQAAPLLHGSEGDAWSISSAVGEFAIALPRGGKLCSVFAREVNGSQLEKRFTALVGSAPPPLIAEMQHQGGGAGITESSDHHELSFTWRKAGESRRLYFALSVSTPSSGPAYAVATTGLIGF
jgi:hypothetical protein